MPTIAEIRDDTAMHLSPVRQEQYEQFLTPASVAQQAVGLFSDHDEPLRVLDLGAGTGILGALTVQRYPGSSITAIERDPQLAAIASESLDAIAPGRSTVIASNLFEVWDDNVYDRVILNPPYQKTAPQVMNTSAGPVRVTNLYTAFLVIAIEHLADNGECVAIIPRSWMNGQYFNDFRQWMLRMASIDGMVIYDSRREHFADMNILQEVMLLHLSRKKQSPFVRVYPNAKPSGDLSEQAHEDIPLQSLLVGRSRILRVRQLDPRLSQFGIMQERGLWASTGKLVWFRNRDILSGEPVEDGFPLYWTDNQHGLLAEHPTHTDREQWVTTEAQDRGLVLPPGSYVIVNRFSSKEQPRRLYASYLHSDVPFVADNKLNYLHAGTSRRTLPLDDAVARGLTMWLGATITDQWYRQMSGSTQVNATDLRQMPCPSQNQLAQLGAHWRSDGNQQLIDQQVGKAFGW